MTKNFRLSFVGFSPIYYNNSGYLPRIVYLNCLYFDQWCCVNIYNLKISSLSVGCYENGD